MDIQVSYCKVVARFKGALFKMYMYLCLTVIVVPLVVCRAQLLFVPKKKTVSAVIKL